MFKKTALFAFAAAAALSASMATARPPLCDTMCHENYRDCIDSGASTAECAAEWSACRDRCHPPRD
ncbi:hypothetical protein [Massilia sp. BJB1822]|uniref:hypothetical protein n=1 Tax=Massilia sp. BJB1822 TaxID=2744470 RepID=UPI0015943692|nr:hypothetical protein [Massilia sp. BJB1822]NVE01022.1 hypothetical protein [Massilia sp. BJB1822]